MGIFTWSYVWKIIIAYELIAEVARTKDITLAATVFDKRFCDVRKIFVTIEETFFSWHTHIGSSYPLSNHLPYDELSHFEINPCLRAHFLEN